MSRTYTNYLLEGIENGLFDKDNIINACTKYMSEADVQDMMEYNGLIEPDQLDNNKE